MSLLSLFLDRYEGIKKLMPEQPWSNIVGIKAHEFTIINSMDPNNKSHHNISLSVYKTIGHLREKIATENRLAINEFNILLKTTIIDPDADDDKYLKDIQ